MKAKEVRSVESRFVDILSSAPGTKEDKQFFFRIHLKMRIARPNYRTMWNRLVQTLGRVGAGEAVFDYVNASADVRLRQLLLAVRSGSTVSLRRKESNIIRRIFYRNGNLRPIGQRFYDYLISDDQRWESIKSRQTIKSSRVTVEALPEFDYDVALSFAGEQRDYVGQVGRALERAGLSYFIDSREETRMWGKDLAAFLEELFRERARYCVMFLSQDYVRKAWPAWEGRAAMARSVMEEHREYVLPVRFDDAEFPGLRPSIKYLDARRLSPEEIADSIIEKVSSSE